MNWRDLLYKTGNEAEATFDKLKRQFRQRMGLFGNLHIQTYTTYATAERFLVKGRVLEYRETAAKDIDKWWRNLAKNYTRFNSNEIAGAKLRITFNNSTTEILTDEDGYFETLLPPQAPLPPEELWHHPVIDLLEAPVPFTPPVSARARVMTPPATAAFGVISDVDDTVLQTGVKSLLNMMKLTFLGNAYSRLPFPGVAAFYTALQKGASMANYNPLFYVSSSPWNLYDFLHDFLKLNKIPEGPLLLKDYGFTHGKVFSESHLLHKKRAIQNILETYPKLPFILIGDSGQHDPEIYEEVVKEFPGRIACIYIRDVSLDERDIQVKKIKENITQHKVEMVFVENTRKAAEHALERGFIHPEGLALVENEG